MIIATLSGGREVILDASYGNTVREVEDRLTGGETLTGSAVPFADVTVLTAAGQRVAWNEIVRLDAVPS
jgi:hypothetical protein